MMVQSRSATPKGVDAISRWLPHSGRHRLTPPNEHFDPSGVAPSGGEVLELGLFL